MMLEAARMRVPRRSLPPTGASRCSQGAQVLSVACPHWRRPRLQLPGQMRSSPGHQWSRRALPARLAEEARL